MKYLIFGAVASLSASGCSGLLVEAYQEPCEDVNLSDPGEPEIFFEADGDDLLIRKSFSFVDVDAVFDPVVEMSGPALLRGYTLEVDEQWKTLNADSGGGTELCLSPGLRLVDGQSTSVSVTWSDTSDEDPVEVTGSY